MNNIELHKIRKGQSIKKSNGEMCCIPGCYNLIDANGRYFGYRTCKGHRHVGISLSNKS